MPFKPGDKKVAGRPKGVPNKRTASLMEILANRGFDPAEKLLDLYAKTQDDHLKANLLNILMKYVYPQRKAIEVSGQIDHKLLTRIEELKAMSPEQLEEARIKALKLVGGKGGS